MDNRKENVENNESSEAAGNSYISVNADEDLAFLSKTQGLNDVSKEKEVEGTFERILAASRRNPQ